MGTNIPHWLLFCRCVLVNRARGLRTKRYTGMRNHEEHVKWGSGSADTMHAYGSSADILRSTCLWLLPGYTCQGCFSDWPSLRLPGVIRASYLLCLVLLERPRIAAYRNGRDRESQTRRRRRPSRTTVFHMHCIPSPQGSCGACTRYTPVFVLRPSARNPRVPRMRRKRDIRSFQGAK